ncbi:sialate O-acetylesterase [bacterium]|nr:sialate O-acetylesterase [bacterium]
MPRLLALFALLAAPAAAHAGAPPVLVFLLAGQSNMEGKAKVSVMDVQAGQPATRGLWAPFRTGDRWAERDDVFVKFLTRRGPLTVGFGSPGCIGPELGFGQVLGDRYPQPVLLIKAAWGGRSLYRDFRPPSAGLPPREKLDAMLADQKKRNAKATEADVKASFGASYRAMLDEYRNTLKDLGKEFPALAGRRTELAGFVWFQGWNDMISAEATAEYAANLGQLICDVRKDLNAPTLPVVVGQMGVDGEKADGNVKRFKAAQAAGMDRPELQGNATLVKTDGFWDTEADAIFRKGWRENLEAWNRVGSDYPYHYLGSPRTMLAIGRALGEAAVTLREGKR